MIEVVLDGRIWRMIFHQWMNYSIGANRFGYVWCRPLINYHINLKGIMMKILTLFDRKDKALHIGGVMWRLFIIPLWFVICLNLAKVGAYLIWNLIMWLGILPYLEKFFGWFVWL